MRNLKPFIFPITKNGLCKCTARFFSWVRFGRGIAGICAVVLLSCALQAGDDPEKALADALKMDALTEKEPPPFSVPSLAGDTLTLQTFQGKLLILHFWATWCVPCRREMPALNQLRIRFPDVPLALLAISIDAPSDTAAARKMAGEWGLRFPVALAAAGSVPGTYWTWGVPVTYLIAPDGRLLGRILGTRNWEDTQVAAALRAYLALLSPRGEPGG